MKRLLILPLPLILPLLIALAFGCDSTDDVREEPFEMRSSNLTLDPVIVRDQELGCGGDEIGGGVVVGNADFSPLGRAAMHISVAWDIGNLLDPEDVQYNPDGPAGGPVAPILGPDEYPYYFQFNPFTGDCGEAVSATGHVELTTENGDRVLGEVVGGETHRLDFATQGDGVESFAVIEIYDGTGRFAGATGSFVLHGIARFDAEADMFVTELVEVLPGGSISY